MLTLDEIHALIHERDAKIEAIRKSGLPVVIYGAGVAAHNAVDYLEHCGITPDACMVDTAYWKQNTFFEHTVKQTNKQIRLPIFCVEKITECYSSFAQIRGCSSNFFRHPAASLYFTPILPLGIFGDLQRMTTQYILDHYSELERTEAWFADEISKKIFNSFLASISASDISYMNGLQTSPQYFADGLLTFGKKETIVDCGAYDGDTIQDYMNCPRCTAETEYYAVEPDPATFMRLQTFAEKNKSPRLRIIPMNCGVGSKKSEICFQSSGAWGSAFHPDGNIKVPVFRLDDMKLSRPVTLLKMDIEGMELDALHGAEGIIMQDKPKLAICVYHKAEDLIAIPLYLKSLVPDYKFKLGYHSEEWTDFVLYAE